MEAEEAKDLMPLAKTGFDAVVARFRPLVLGTALHVTGQVELAEDATQEALIALYQHFDDIKTPAAIGAWLRTTVRRIAYTLVRRERHPVRRVLGDAPLGDDVIEAFGRPAVDAPGEALVEREQVARALATIAALDSRDREVLVGELLGSESRETLAAYLDLSPTTLRKRVQRAREALQRLGHDPEALAESLGLVRWPRDAAERARRSAEARTAAEEALDSGSDPVRGMAQIADRVPFERAYALGALALALDPHDARCHALMVRICLWLAKNAAVDTAPTDRDSHAPEALTGLLGGAPLEQAMAHARLAERLAPNEPQVCLAVAFLLMSTAAAPATIPWDAILALARRARDVQPDSLDFAGCCLTIAMRLPHAAAREWTSFESTLRRCGVRDRKAVLDVSACMNNALGLGYDRHAARLLAILRDELRPAPEIEALYGEALAAMAQRLADPDAFRRSLGMP